MGMIKDSLIDEKKYMKDLNYKIKVMEHCRNGGKVEFRDKQNKCNEWISWSYPTWNWSYFDYRIKE